jgi:hypothetical protein
MKLFQTFEEALCRKLHTSFREHAYFHALG